MQEIQLIFNPGKGGTVPLSRITAIVGDRVGALPKPTRKGYVFAGWYLSPSADPEAPDALRIASETVLEAAMLCGETAEATLYARWKKPAGKGQASGAGKAGRRSSLANQKKAIVALSILTLLLIAAFVAVSIIVDIYEYEDFDGVTYTIKKKQGEYGLYKSGTVCDTDKDGYYLTDLGTMLSVDPKTGEYRIYAVVDTTGTEVVGPGQRVLMFKQLTYDASSTSDLSKVIKSIEVHNQNGSFTVQRGNGNRFEVKDHDSAVLVDELFAKLSSGCGYTISMQRLENPVRTDSGAIDYTEYGLAPETRTRRDDDGNPVTDSEGNPVTYAYTPSHYTVTTMTEDTYSVTVGDATVSGGGYYARYEDRDTVYILASGYFDEAVLRPITALINPLLVFPMTMNSYFQVSNFTYRADIDHAALYRAMLLELVDFDILSVTPDEDGNLPPEAAAKVAEASALIDGMPEEDFSALYDRLLKAHSRLVTAFSYIDMDERENTLHSAIPYRMSSEYMAGYLPNSDNIGKVLQKLYSMTFVGVTVLGPTEEDLETYGLDAPAHDISFIYKNAEGQEYTNHFVVSPKTEDGLYYGYAEVFDMIVCFDESQAEYLEWAPIDWYEREYFSANIAHVQTVKLEGTGLSAPLVFTLDNSKTDQSQGVASDLLEVYANGQLMDYTLTVTKPSGSRAEENAAYNFRRFFQALLTASMEDEAKLTEEEMAALRATPDSECFLKLTVCADDGQGNTRYCVYRFYRYTERRAYLTVEVLDDPNAVGDPTKGQGTFCVLRSFCDKLIADAGRFLAGEEIVVDSKN